MPKLIFQILILGSGWAVQILEGSPTTGVDLQENQIVSQHITPEQLRSLQVIIIIIIVSSIHCYLYLNSMTIAQSYQNIISDSSLISLTHGVCPGEQGGDVSDVERP